MVRLTRIYTRGGDTGETSLGDGSRVPKQALRVEAFGTVDEANAAIGLARLHVGSPADADTDAMLARIQNDLFDLGADLCTPEDSERTARKGALRIAAAQVARLEREIDRMNAGLKPLDSFILPGGTPAAAYLRLGGRGEGQHRGDQILEPVVGPPVRAGAAAQRQWRPGCAVAAGPDA